MAMLRTRARSAAVGLGDFGVGIFICSPTASTHLAPVTCLIGNVGVASPPQAERCLFPSFEELQSGNLSGIWIWYVAQQFMDIPFHDDVLRLGPGRRSLELQLEPWHDGSSGTHILAAISTSAWWVYNKTASPQARTMRHKQFSVLIFVMCWSGPGCCWFVGLVCAHWITQDCHEHGCCLCLFGWLLLVVVRGRQ